MRKLARIICASLALFGISSFAAETTSSGLQPGIWVVEEVLHIPLSGDRMVMWKYHFLVDIDGTIIGVGRNETVKASENGGAGAISMVILESTKATFCEGFYIQAYEDGGLFQMRIQGDVAVDGKAIVLDSIDSDGMVASTIHASWVRSEESAPVHEGKWEVREIVSPDRGGWNIVWDFNFSNNAGTLTGQGNKVQENERSAYPGERKTVSRVSLNAADSNSLSIYGTAQETNHVGGVIRAEYEGWLSPTGKWFLVESYENGKLAGLLLGNVPE